jgi:hypothetical protein
MDAATGRLVRKRASDRCEYCRLPQHAVEATFHVAHIVARQHQWADDPSNLALACDRCNLFKGPNLSGIDPASGAVVSLFHPRRQHWQEHFALDGAELVGLTATGRTTIQLLQMNAPRRLHLRALLLRLGETFGD